MDSTLNKNEERLIRRPVFFYKCSFFSEILILCLLHICTTALLLIIRFELLVLINYGDNIYEMQTHVLFEMEQEHVTLSCLHS